MHFHDILIKGPERFHDMSLRPIFEEKRAATRFAETTLVETMCTKRVAPYAQRTDMLGKTLEHASTQFLSTEFDAITTQKQDQRTLTQSQHACNVSNGMRNVRQSKL